MPFSIITRLRLKPGRKENKRAKMCQETNLTMLYGSMEKPEEDKEQEKDEREKEQTSDVDVVGIVGLLTSEAG